MSRLENSIANLAKASQAQALALAIPTALNAKWVWLALACTASIVVAACASTSRDQTTKTQVIPLPTVTSQNTPSSKPISIPNPSSETQPDTESATVFEKDKSAQTGTASWYGGKFHGRKTANGERFDENGFTAAHRTLKFGTWVLVENTRNGKTVKVRINDRGPFTKGRIIDLSQAAAKQIGITGVGKVRIRQIEKP